MLAHRRSPMFRPTGATQPNVMVMVPTSTTSVGKDDSLTRSSWNGSSSPCCNNKGHRRSHALLPLVLMVIVLSAISTRMSLNIERQVSVLLPDKKPFAESGFLPLLTLGGEKNDGNISTASLRGRVSSDDSTAVKEPDVAVSDPESNRIALEHRQEVQLPASAAQEEQQNTKPELQEEQKNIKPELQEEQKQPQQEQAEPLTEQQQQQQSDEKPAPTAEHKKPRFILHVGPMKTGTSSLQADLDWLLGDQLEQDGWMYIKSESPFNSIPTDDPEVFLQMFKEEADKLLPLKKNVIRSREQYSDYFSERPWMYERLRDILVDWDVEVHAGYRTYDGWLVSYYYQAYRMPFSDHRNPEERTKNPWRKDNGELFWIEPLFPNFFKFWKNRKRFTDAVVETAGPVLPVKIFDIHSAKGARSTFLCDALGEGAAPISCAESLRMDRENPPLEVNKSNVKELQYDAIALGAVGKGMVDEHRFRRSEVVDAIVARQEGELQRTVSDFPLICPDDSTYQEFWNLTLARDALCMPEKYQADPHYETKFHEKFLQSVDKKKFCRVDVDAVLADVSWQQFFAKYAPPQPVENV